MATWDHNDLIYIEPERRDPWQARNPFKDETDAYDNIPSDVEPDQATPKSNPLDPDHYKRWAIQPIDFIRANKLRFEVGNVIKYTMRWDAKDGLQDLKKARRYLDWLIEEAEQAQP